MKKRYLDANAVAEILGISKAHAYKIIRGLNNELKEQGYIVIAGKIPTSFFETRCYCYETA